MEDKYLNWKIIFAGLALAVFLFGAYYFLSQELYFAVRDLLSNANIVEVNVYALWMPVGSIGFLIWYLCTLGTAIWYKKQTNSIWSDKTRRVFNRLIGFFMVLGLFFAIGTYQWLTSELDARGYVYSEEKSQLSAMGKHEVYIKP